MFDDDGESVTLGFGGLPGGVAAGTVNEVTVSITDNDDPSVTVRFERTTYTIDEGDSFSINVILSADPEGPVTIPIATTIEDAAEGELRPSRERHIQRRSDHGGHQLHRHQ